MIQRMLLMLSLISAGFLWASSSANAQGLAWRSTNADRATANYLLSRPTVSPYLNLLRPQSELTPPNYHTLVRPQLESRERAARQEVEIGQLQSRVTNMQGQMAARGRRDQAYATGHPTRFMVYMHYYPALNRR